MKKKNGIIRIFITFFLWTIFFIINPNLRGPESNLDLEIITYVISILSLTSIGLGVYQIAKKN